jgi:hypothetical protein
MNSNAPDAHPEAVEAALRAMDEYLVAFNARDLEAVDAALNYPSIRLTEDGALHILERGHYTLERMQSGSLQEWGHSVWEQREPVQASEDKVHIAVEFTRYRPDGSKIATYNTLYVVTRQDGHWGIKLRSSFVP